MSPHAKPSGSFRDPIGYEKAVFAQEELVRRRQASELPDLLWLLEHPLTITSGTSGKAEHLRLPPERLAAQGAEFHETRRGGDVTCHEPGQLVGYPIVRLADRGEDRDIHLFLRRLEDALIAVLADYGLEGRGIEGRTGVWLPGSPDRKIIAMGVRCNRWVTSHGFAFNVENDLAGFGMIVPCGIADAAVTSLQRELAEEAWPTWDEVETRTHRAIESALDRELVLVRGAEMFDRWLD